MTSQDLTITAPALGEAIDRHPLIVTADTLLTETLGLMSQVQNLRCSLPNFPSSAPENSFSPTAANCVLIMKGEELQGIFTERDLVRLIASNLNFEGVTMGQVMTQPVVTLQEANFQDIFAVLFLFRRYRIRHLPIVGVQGQLMGVVSPESLRACLRPSNLLKLRRVSEVINSQVIQGGLSDKVIDLARLMAEAQVSCVVIVEELPQEPSLPVGIITERDLLQFQALGLDLGKVRAEAVMSTPLFLLNPEDSLWIAHQEMQRRRVRRLVVSWNWGQGLGLVTQTSLLRVFDPIEMYGVIETLQHTVQQLEAEKIDSSARPASDFNQVKLGLSNQSGQLMESKGKSDSQEEGENPRHKAPAPFLQNRSSRPQQPEIESGLCALQTKLALLANEPQMPQVKKEQLLSLAIADVEELKKLWQKNSSVI